MFYTELKHRKLFFDGISSYNPNDIIQLQSKYNINWVDFTTPIIDQFNKLASKNKKIQIKTDCNPFNTSWNLPDVYKTLNVVDYVLDKHIEVTKGMCESDIIDRDSRLISELMMYKEADKLDVLRTIIYMVEMLEQHNVVYGVGRGSSVSSYVLYVIGIHDIDSFAYDLDINDFFHD